MTEFNANFGVQIRYSTRARNLDNNRATVRLAVPLGAGMDLAANLAALQGQAVHVTIEPLPGEDDDDE